MTMTVEKKKEVPQQPSEASHLLFGPFCASSSAIAIIHHASVRSACEAAAAKEKRDVKSFYINFIKAETYKYRSRLEIAHRRALRFFFSFATFSIAPSASAGASS